MLIDLHGKRSFYIELRIALFKQQTHRIPGTTEDAGWSNRFQRDQWQFGDGLVINHDLQCADLGIFRNWCNQWIVTFHAWLHLVSTALRDRHIDVMGKADLDLALRALPHIRCIDRLALAVKLDRVEVLEAPVQQLLAFLGPNLVGNSTDDDRNQTTFAIGRLAEVISEKPALSV